MTGPPLIPAFVFLGYLTLYNDLK